jgi:transposase-like protein
MSKPRNYPEELLERAVRLALERGRPIAHAARDLGINSEVLRKRVRQVRHGAGSTGACKTPSAVQRGT